MKILNYEKEIDKNTDETFSKALTEASLTYQHHTRSIDDDDRAFVRQLVRDKRKKNAIRFTKTVAVVLVVVSAGMLTSIWSPTDGVYGKGDFVQKIVNVISPFDTKEIVDDENGRVKITTVRNESDITRAKSVFEELEKAEYLPEGYNFDKMTISQSDYGTSIEYIYSRNKDVIIVAFEYATENSSIGVIGDRYVSSKTGKCLYVDEDKEENISSVIEITDAHDCMVMGNTNKDEAIKIIESIAKVE